MEDIAVESDSDEPQSLNMRIRQCLSIESDDPIVQKIQACLKDVIAKSRNSESGLASKKSQWHTW